MTVLNFLSLVHQCLQLSCKYLKDLLMLLNQHPSVSHASSKSAGVAECGLKQPCNQKSFAVRQTGLPVLPSGSDPILYPTETCNRDVLCTDLGTKSLLFGPQSSHFLSFIRPTYWFVDIIIWIARTFERYGDSRKTGGSFRFLLLKRHDCFCKVEVGHSFECLYVFRSSLHPNMFMCHTALIHAQYHLHIVYSKPHMNTPYISNHTYMPHM